MKKIFLKFKYFILTFFLIYFFIFFKYVKSEEIKVLDNIFSDLIVSSDDYMQFDLKRAANFLPILCDEPQQGAHGKPWILDKSTRG